MSRFRNCLMAWLLLSPALALAQGVLVNVDPNQSVALPRPGILPHPLPTPRPRPIPQSTYKIKELSVQVKLADQVARTQVSQSFVNTGSQPMEVSFVFPLPYDGAIDSLTLLVDGKEFPARLLPAAEARRVYEDIVRKNRDPALLEWIGAGMFQTSVFPVPAGAERKVTLRYSQLCRQDQGLTDFLFPLSTARYTSHPVEKVDFQIAIESGAEIKNVYSPTHPVDIKRPDNKHALVSWTLANQVPGTDFRLLYDVGAGQVGASVLSYRRDAADDGYFLLLASPQIKAADQARIGKNVIFVVDRSGSMSGEKFNQAKGALRFVLNNLRSGDLFNVIAYDNRVESFRPELQRYDESTCASALGFVEGLFAGGSTNIDAALGAALSQLKDSSRPNYVVFLTDGLPTDGVQSEAQIVANAKANNQVRARTFVLGVGYDVNSRLLDKLARENFGQSEYVRPNESIEARVSALYARIESPVMTELAIRFELDAPGLAGTPPVNRVYPADGYDLFAGQQLVVVGRYRQAGAGKVALVGKVGGQEQRFEFACPLIEKSADDTNSFVEKLWAARRIGEIIDQLDLKGRNEELVKELVDLSTRHGILTQYTSFLADESSDRRDLGQARQNATRELEQLSEVAGESAVKLRIAKSQLQMQAQAAPAEALRQIGGQGGRGAFSFYDARQNKDVVVDSVQTIGSKTFYRRAGRWVDAALSAEQEKAAAKVERFSREYFRLIDENGSDVAKYLNFDEPVVIEIRGQAYAF